jgi:hypothetical protein
MLSISNPLRGTFCFGKIHQKSFKLTEDKGGLDLSLFMAVFSVIPYQKIYIFHLFEYYYIPICQTPVNTALFF